MEYGQEDYQRYYYLWHLVALGVLNVEIPVIANECPKILGTIWEDDSFVGGRTDVTVGLIDMGVAHHHPNLEPKTGDLNAPEHRVVWEHALDLASHRYGAKYGPMNARHLEERAQHLTQIDDTIVATTPGESEILQRLKTGCGVKRYVEVYNQSYATHGTACAGLVCGTSFSDDQFGNEGNIITYYGVDPFSRVIPITTSISPDPEQLIAAFLYAHSLGVDVILAPRDAADPDFMPGYGNLDQNEKTRLDNSDEVNIAWDLLGKVIRAVSMDIPVVCAAGNDGRSDLIYPASLAKEAGNGVIAVGAVSHSAYRSGYSNYGDGLTVVAPSDDGEVYNRHQVRLDMQAVDINDFWVDGVHDCPEIPAIDFSAERLLTLDVPGLHGYASGSRRGPPTNRADAADDPAGLYTGFGGTSGAAAIVAGIVTLMKRQNGAGPLLGPEVKGRFTVGAPNINVAHWYWLKAGRTELTVDAVNGLPQPSETDLFGEGGLVNVPNLLGIPWP